MQECVSLLDQSLIMITSLQEDPTLQQLETKERELQQACDNVKGTMQMVAIM